MEYNILSVELIFCSLCFASGLVIAALHWKLYYVFETKNICESKKYLYIYLANTNNNDSCYLQYEDNKRYQGPRTNSFTYLHLILIESLQHHTAIHTCNTAVSSSHTPEAKICLSALYGTKYFVQLNIICFQMTTNTSPFTGHRKHVVRCVQCPCRI